MQVSKRSLPPLKRFWSKVAVKVGQVNESYEPCGSRFCAGCQGGGHCWQRWPCWEWKGKPDKKGYGTFWIDEHRRSKSAHKVAWELSNKVYTLPYAFVCHHCDNPICCNPKHLFLGDIVINTADKVAKGRQARGAEFSASLKPRLGEENHNSKLSEFQVKEILAEIENGVTLAELGRRYDVHETCIGHIKLGRSWKYLTKGQRLTHTPNKENLLAACVRGTSSGMAKLNEWQACQVIALHLMDWTNLQIAQRLSVCEGTISHVITGKTWHHVFAFETNSEVQK